MCKFVGNLFDERPVQWGLRGDPYMWMDLRERFSTTPLPDSSDDFEKLVKETFYATIADEAIIRRLDTWDAKEEDSCWIRRFSHGGLSSGQISLDFWERKAFPMLVERFKQHRAC
ncbi:hypothetical protein [Corynebacterium falsenii]|uniref:hypothetical protein n=1 Tax=Corynebacterium falsenii TaxID=108486 RepID=UPI003FD63412